MCFDTWRKDPAGREPRTRERCKHPVGNLKSDNTLYYLLGAPILPLRRLAHGNHPPIWGGPS